ncbi:MAG: hypothetical protein U0Q16_13480 [Bryobacteraceae bacterium]
MKLAAWILMTALPTAAQTFLFSYQTTPTSAAVTVSPNGTINFPTIAAGFTATISFVVSNRDTAEWALTEATASGPYSTNAKPTTVLPTGGTFFSIFYSPTAQSGTTGTLAVKLRGPNGVTSPYSFSLAAGTETTAPGTPRVEQGSALVSYINYNGGNQTVVNSGDTIPFPETTVATRVSLAVIINNRLLSATTTFASASISGAGFETSGLPILPATIQPGSELRFTIAFFPDRTGDAEGELRLTAGGTSYAIRLKARAVAPSLDLELVTADGVTRISSGGTIQFPLTTSNNGRSLLRFRIHNTGNADGRFGVASLSSPSFQLVDPPAPTAIRPGEIVPFSIAFIPRDVGSHFGQLRIDNSQYNLEGKASGAQLTMALAVDDAVTPLRENALVVVPNTPVGARRTFFVEVRNTGDEQGFLSAVSVNGDGFSMVRTVSFPLSIPAGQTVRIPALFSPLETGTVRGSLLVHDLSYTLVGVGDEPPPLPKASFLGLPQRGEALQQPAVALELAESYPYDLTGKLTLSFTSESLIDDPAVQFISGNRTVDFRIPAKTTRAIFGSSLREIRLQTGSLAGTITLVASVSVGKFDLTRSTPPVATVDIPAGPPVIRTLAISARSAKAFDVVIGGAAPSRSVSRFIIDLTPSPGARLQATKLTVEVGQQFDSWFSSTNSRPFGGQFLAVVTIQTSADYSAVASLAVRAVNSLGTSAAKTVVVTPKE